MSQRETIHPKTSVSSPSGKNKKRKFQSVKSDNYANSIDKNRTKQHSGGSNSEIGGLGGAKIGKKKRTTRISEVVDTGRDEETGACINNGNLTRKRIKLQSGKSQFNSSQKHSYEHRKLEKNYKSKQTLESKSQTDIISTKETDKLHFPVSASEISCNWRKLQKVIAKKSSKRTKKLPNIKVASLKKSDHKKRVKSDESSMPLKGVQEVWFDDVDELLLEVDDPGPTNKGMKLVKDNCFTGPTKYVSIDCEMVGVGFQGRENILARVSVVNQYGYCLLDKYVRPREDVSDYRTHVSGITPDLVIKACEFKDVQKEVCDAMEGRILVGHAIKNDLKALFLSHPRKMIRDTATYKPFRRLFDGKTPGLKALSKKLLGVTIQDGQHDSVEDAQAAMRIYILVHKDWEKGIQENRGTRKSNKL